MTKDTGIYLYKNLEINNPEILDELDWSRTKNNNYWKLHSVASYLAMFAPSLPDYFIQKYSKENDLVMDNFSGRGTTALVCRQRNRKFVGTDLNPYAYVLTKFKISNLKIKNFIKRLNELKQEYKQIEKKYAKEAQKQQYDDLKPFYNPKTLAQLIFLRNKIGINWKTNDQIDNAILAIAMGIMHGPTKKDGSTIYFSVDMPNTISFTPNYVKQYVKKHNLICQEVDVFANISSRFIQMYTKEIEANKYKGSVYLADATKENQLIKNNSVSLVITSPPYVNLVNYTVSNWLRLWLLGFERNELTKTIKLSDKVPKDEYSKFIAQYLQAIYHKLKNKAKVCLVVGDVHNTKLIEDVWKNISKKLINQYRFLEIYYDYNYKQKKKVTNMLGKKSQATLIEKVLVLEKI